jgi:hypothetical protein
LSFSFRCGGDKPNVTDTETGKSAESERLVARVSEQCISAWLVWMMEMMLIAQCKQDHEKDTVDDRHSHEKQRGRERRERAVAT